MRRVLPTAVIALVSLVAWGARRPTIGHVTSVATPTSCTVTWTTDVGSDSLLALATGMGPYIPAWSQMESATTDKTGNGVTNHTATINEGLFPGGQYTIYLRSRPVSSGVVDTKPGDTGWYDGASNCNILKDGSQCICGGHTLPVLATAGSTWDFKYGFMGPRSVVQGYDAYIYLEFANTAQPVGYAYGPNMNLTVRGYPKGNGEVAGFYDPHYHSAWDSATGTLVHTTSGAAVDLAFRLRTTSKTPLGKYTLTFTAKNVKYPDVVHSYTYALEVVAPAVLPTAAPAAYPAIPNLRDWVRGMVDKGGDPRACGGSGPGANFYDGIRAYLQTQAFDKANNVTHHPEQWDKCIANRKAGYLGYINSTKPPGAIKSILLGSKGLAVLASRGDTEARTALFNTADHAQWRTLRPVMIDPALERELNFTTEAFIAANSVGDHEVASYIPLGIDMLLGQVDQIVNAHVSHEPFLDGTIADTLIHYYEDNGRTDVRIPAAIKSLADHLWVNYWIPGPCSGEKQQYSDCFVYSAGMRQMGIDYSTNGAPYNDPDLNLLIAPMYAWLFKMTGNAAIPGSDGSQCRGTRGQPCTYQQAGDAIFSSGATQSGYWNIVKEWDQNFRWSFDYVTWRSPANSQK